MSKVTMWRSRWRCVIEPAYSVSFLLSINLFVWQNVLYFPNDPRNRRPLYRFPEAVIMIYFRHKCIYLQRLTQNQLHLPDNRPRGPLEHSTATYGVTFLHNFTPPFPHCSSYSVLKNLVYVLGNDPKSPYKTEPPGYREQKNIFMRRHCNKTMR